MSLLLALAAAASYGVADFCGGTASRRSPALAVLLVSTPVGMLAVLLATPLGPSQFSAGLWAWGTAAGIAGGLGIPLLYRGLAVGPMSVVAPLTAVTSAAVPVAGGLLLGERPGALAGAGVVLAVVAVALVARGGSDGSDGSGAARRGGVALALLSGAAFGLFFTCTGAAPDGSGLWPLVVARAVAWVVTAVAAAGTGQLTALPRRALPLVVLAGVLDAAGNALYLVAVRGGLLSLVGVVVALYPASTVLLARAVHAERLARPQAIGLGVAAAAVSLLALGT